MMRYIPASVSVHSLGIENLDEHIFVVYEITRLRRLQRDVKLVKKKKENLQIK